MEAGLPEVDRLFCCQILGRSYFFPLRKKYQKG